LTLEGFLEDVHRFPSYFHTSFPMLRSLKVITTSKYDVRDKGQTVNFIAAFPTIEEVVLTSKSTLLLVLGDRKPAKEPLWPELRIMTIVDPCVPWAERPDQSPVSLFDVIKAVKRRIVSGQPVFSVKLSAAIFKRAEQSHLEQLMEGTSLEVLDE
jgi:hypothetical protein